MPSEYEKVRIYLPVPIDCDSVETAIALLRAFREGTKTEVDLQDAAARRLIKVTEERKPDAEL